MSTLNARNGFQSQSIAETFTEVSLHSALWCKTNIFMLIKHVLVKIQFLNILSCTVSITYDDIEYRYLCFPPEYQHHCYVDVAFGNVYNLSPRDYTTHSLIKLHSLGLEVHMSFISINNTSKRNEICLGTLCKNKSQATGGNSCFHRESSKLGRP